MIWSTTLPDGYANNYREWYLVRQPPTPDAFYKIPGIVREQEDWYARAGALVLAPAADLPRFRLLNETTGAHYSWIPAAEAHAALAGASAADPADLRRLQEQLAAKQAVIDRCRAWLEEARA